ncbi:hypothetical protein SNOG_01431 [Parastagonospora nodorum SN15]|uniref:Uncharacterized protein n=1 Tax=Phaeosphaeria nodorum (strain SN15 / ATCC MYA-4574 / FGSC 10173) TaxID=321614 RepID=Q0V3I3_PHANO|nr:hypothetical protein SNOG_01431 [Parastagonospora nodorum SN15]EAT91080.1 hypothetical protein SNOG_01431 [Parastagonospora nodorum SN15]
MPSMLQTIFGSLERTTQAPSWIARKVKPVWFFAFLFTPYLLPPFRQGDTDKPQHLSMRSTRRD